MSLTEIEYGSLASSEIMNNNFEFLDNKISSVSESIVTNIASVNSNIASINSSIASLSDDINNSLDDLDSSLENTHQIFSESGIYITTYINGSSWYREYFSDAAKTQRVWLEQGGVITISGDYNYTVTFLKNFSNTNYCIFKNMGRSGTGGVAERWIGFWGLTVSSAVTGALDSFVERWYACGI